MPTFNPEPFRTQTEQLRAPLRYCLYARKSSEAEERQALSIDSQIAEMQAVAERDGLFVADIRRESHSAKESGQRLIYSRLLEDIRNGTFNAVLTWAPDRLSRNAGDLGGLVDLMDQGKLIEIRTASQRFTNSPNEKFLLMILCSQAKLENDNRGVNVKRGLKVKAQMGWRPNKAPLGYINTKTHERGGEKVILDSERALIIKEMFERVANYGWSGRALYRWMYDETSLRTRANKRVTLSMIYLMLRNPYYCGKFKHGDEWYKVAHESIITEELFDDVQRQLSAEPRAKGVPKEFHFTKLIACGSCGGGVTAEEKFKILRDGSRKRYVYYHCGRTVNMDCKEPAIREEELVSQLADLIGSLEINSVGARQKLQEELERHQRFMQGVLGASAAVSMPKIDIKKYALYVLQHGSREERREMLGEVKSRLALRGRSIFLVT